jgi:[glutamine synthetase] adenylyltransferase / [glutamine synthetase]-adenylyl-L-tyrosine phosphorylase
MTSPPIYQQLLDEDRFLWQPIADYLEAGQFSATLSTNIERLAVASHYALGQLQRAPEWIERLATLERFELDGAIIEPAAEQRIDLDQVKRALRQYRHRKLVEIIYLDVVAGQPVEATLLQLSDLADQLIGCALDIAQRQLSAKHGQPVDASGAAMGLNIIAMGKLGGQELNFSSDIDLICCYESDGELCGYGQLSYQEYFSRVVRLLNQLLGEATADGFVYRVDLRLRPWGDSGPVVLSHSALEHYYQLHGREWEQYAMVKARIISGGDASRGALASLLKPFVYRKYLDYRVFDGLATLKSKIDAQAKSRGMRVNLKLGPGGIREIEFFVQAFQILRGGRNHRLQCSSILEAFDALQRYDIVDAGNLRQLHAAYCFLRLLENRLQMFADQQTHDLPDQPAVQLRIAATLNFGDWDSILRQLESYRAEVSSCFNDLFRQHRAPASGALLDEGFTEGSDTDHRWDFIDAAGIAQADEITASLNRFVHSKAWKFMSARARQRFSLLLPGLITTIRQSQQTAVLFDRLLRLFSSIAGRSVYFELLFHNQPLLERLVSLFDRSEWIANEVSQYPMLLENLIQPAERDRFDKSLLLQRLQQQLASIEGDTELELDSLRLFKREQTLVIASAELVQEIDAEQVSHYLCDLAEVVLEAVYQLANRALQQRHGAPECVVDGERRVAQLAIIGYGKLGGRELHYQSDLDLIFLHDSSGEQQHTNGAKTVENSVFFARLAQKIISMTSVLTASGKLYEIDSRLRPEGSSGLLVSSTTAYLRYQLEKAWTWEHQALVRARLVAGSDSLQGEFERIRRQVLCLPRDAQQLGRDIVDMRERMYQAKRPVEGERVDLKHSRGGMVDIEFMVQYWVLARANSIGSDCLYSDNISLLKALFRLELITAAQSQLIEIYQGYHRLLHQSVLQNQSAEVDAELIAGHLAHVKNCWNECFSLLEK